MRVNLPLFEGPLDLLLYLIKKNEFDIFDIPISQITQEYLEYLSNMEKLNMEIATEFIVMAAKLLQIKVMMLLRGDEEAEEDPREELVSALISYQAFKEAVDFLLSREILNKDVFLKSHAKKQIEDEEVWTELSPSDLMLLMKDILKRMKKPSFQEIEIEKVSVVEKVKFIIEKTSENKTFLFDELVSEISNLMHLVAFILAILELMRLGIVKVVQMKPFGKIMVYRTEKKFEENLLKGIEEYGERRAQEDN